MYGSGKETVIIVHGTWAAPEPGRSRWYEPVAGAPATRPFTAKLDAALKERGSPARCWAHCHEGNQIFRWSGANTWIARARAASDFGDYVARLRDEGWRCHIVAHSHGGNIVADALPQIMAMTDVGGPPGKIATLGTPFIDAMSPILERARRRTRILNGLSWAAFPILMLVIYLSVKYLVTPGLVGNHTEHQRTLESFIDLQYIFPIIPVSILVLPLFLRLRGRSKLRDSRKPGESSQTQPLMLVIGSLMDETWQIMHHMRNIHNPMAIRLSLVPYLFSSIRSDILQRAAVSSINGAKDFHDLGVFGKSMAGIMHLTFHAAIILIIGFMSVDDLTLHLARILDPSIAIPYARQGFLEAAFYSLGVQIMIMGIIFASAPMVYLIALVLTRYIGDTFHSAFWSPYRRYARLLASFGSIVPGVAIYTVRRKAWSVLLAMTMGLERYPHRLPYIEQHPSHVPPNFVKYENMPKGAEQRAVTMRNAWIGRHFNDVTQTFSKMLLTPADITSLLRTVEADQSLVHAAYYTDDECIARIADWIAGRG